MPILRKGVVEIKKFSELFIGEEFSLTVRQLVGPYIKVTKNSYALEIPAPLSNSRLFVAVTTMTGRVRWGLLPTTQISPSTIIYGPFYNPLSPPIFSQSVPSGPSGFQGNDPILGFPYPPVDYQLFVVPLSAKDFPYGGSSAGPPATLYWTVPSLIASPSNYRIYNDSGAGIYYAKRPAPVGPVSWTLIPSGHFASENSATILTQYVAFRKTPTSNPAINEFQIGPCSGDDVACPIHGTPQAGWVSSYPHQLWPGASSTASVMIWDGRDATDQVPNPFDITKCTLKFKGPPPGDTIDHFTLERAVNTGASWTLLQSAIPGSSTIAPDTQGRVIGNNYFYRLTGHTVGLVSFPYNIVGLISPLILTAIPGARDANNAYLGTTLKWTPPDTTNWPTS